MLEQHPPSTTDNNVRPLTRLTRPSNVYTPKPKTNLIRVHVNVCVRRRTREERARAALGGSAEGEEDLDDIITSPVQLEVEVRRVFFCLVLGCNMVCMLTGGAGVY